MKEFLIFLVCLQVTFSENTNGRPDECSFVLETDDDVQTFASVNHPSTYNDSTDCWWTISASDGAQVQLTFDSVHTEGCCDIIYIHDGDTTEAPLLATLRGEILAPSVFVSTFGVLFVSFVTDESVVDNGFSAKYQAVTENGTDILFATSEPNYLNSTNYPDKYENNVLQSWFIQTEEFFQISLEFHDFNTESCCDAVKIYDVVGNDFRLITTMRGRNRTFPVYTSSSTAMFVIFSSDNDVRRRGFQATYQAVPNVSENQTTESTVPEQCGSELVVPRLGHGEFHAPIDGSSVKRKYKIGVNCVWTIRAPEEDQRIRLWFPYIHLEECCDYLVVRDGAMPSSPKLGALSGFAERFHTFRSSGSVLRVEFTSDHVASVGKGFRGVYELNKDDTNTSACGGNLNAIAVPQYFSSPNWPDGAFMNNQSCAWIIRAPGTQRIIVTLIGVMTEPFYDILQVLDGSTVLDRKIFRLSGTYYLRVHAVSTGPSIRVEFDSDGSVMSAGFRAVYKTITSVREYIAASGATSTTGRIS